MRRISKIYYFFVFILLVLLRLFVSGPWLGSITVCGLFVTWFDMLNQIWEKNKNLSPNEKSRYGFIILILAIIGLALLLLTVLNLIVPLKWLTKQIVLDEITLLALMFCVMQKDMVSIICKIIKSGKNFYKG